MSHEYYVIAVSEAEATDMRIHFASSRGAWTTLNAFSDSERRAACSVYRVALDVQRITEEQAV